MKRLALVILSLLAVWTAKAQTAADTLGNDALRQLLINQVERLAEDSDEGVDFEDLLEGYLFLNENPVNLNSEETVRLVELHLLSDFQHEALQDYRRRYGDFLFLDELKMVEGFDGPTLALLFPVVYIGKDPDRGKLTFKNMARYGKHRIVGHYDQVLEKQQGYLPIDDSVLQARPNSRYLGSPQRYQLRYAYNYRDKIRAGITLEKDAGELSITDFVGFHLYAKDLGIVKAAALGDYHLTYGQGLTLWSGLSFGKAAGSVMKRGSGIRPKASASEYGFFRGAAVTIGQGPYSYTVFYSNRKIDANVSLADSLDEAELVSSIQESGYHRTFGELQDRHAIRQEVVGQHLSYATAHFEVGYTLHSTWLSVPLQPKPTLYNQFYFSGSRLTNQGIDFKYVKGKYAVFGEVAMRLGGGDRGSQPAMTGSGENESQPVMSGSGENESLPLMASMAGLVELTVKPAGYLDFTLMYRDYGKGYQNFFSNAFGEGSRNQGQRGIYLGTEVAPAPYWHLLAYVDLFQFTWLTSQVDAPSRGHDYCLRLSHSFSKRVSAILQIRSKTKMKNSSDAFTFSPYPIFYTKNSVRFNIDYQVGDFHLGNKAEYAHYRNDDGSNERGYFLCQDVAYKPESKPYSLSFRYALFDAKDYNARIFAYEDDVLYQYSIPAFYGKGMRVYLLGKVKLFNALTLYARIGRTVYTDRNAIGEGLTLIEGNHKTDLKVEAIWKL